MGRVLALSLQQRGFEVVIDDPDPSGESACAWTGAGMLAPASELDGGERLVFELGREAMSRWPALLAGLPRPVPLDMTGTLIVAHASDRGEFERFQRALDAGGGRYEPADRARIAELEPALDFDAALYLPDEGHVDNRALIAATNCALDIGKIDPDTEGCSWAGSLHTGSLRKAQGHPILDDAIWHVDCRGLAAKDRLPELRGVRGELIYIHAPEVSLNRPVRILHPRYPLYIVPREQNTFVVGASQIESEDRSPISVRSALELLSAAYAIHPGFAEGRILDTSVHCRPAFPDHLPRIYLDRERRRMAINGLFRHGFLLAPILAEFAVDLIEKGIEPSAPILHSFPT